MQSFAICKFKTSYLLIIVACFVIGVVGCKKNAGEYYNFKNSSTYNGNAYAFLLAQPAGQYDSLLFAIDRVTGLKDSLQNFQNISFFAVTNQSLSIAIQNLNRYRQIEMKNPLYLSTVDSAQLDTLLCRYVLKQKTVADTLSTFSDGLAIRSLRYDYNMHVLYQKGDALGYVEGGAIRLQFTDPKSTIFNRFWVSTYTLSSGTNVSNGIVLPVSSGHEFGFGEFTQRMNK